VFAGEQDFAFRGLPIHGNGVKLLLDKEWGAACRGAWLYLLSFVDD
jgi:hypothetical protein